MKIWKRHARIGAISKIALITILGLLLTACGGNDKKQETAPSSAQPTVEATSEATSDAVEATAAIVETAPVNTDMSSPGIAATNQGTTAAMTQEATLQGTLESQEQASEVATPSVETPGASATSTTDESETEGATSEATATQEESASGEASQIGDGTTGASMPRTSATETPVASSSAIDANTATPASSASPAASPVSSEGTPAAAVEPPIVTSCDVENVPAFTGDVTTYVLEVDLNFRTGPGSDCDLIGDGPLGEFSAVEAIGGPVIREGDDTPEWTQVRVGNQTGWLAAEFLAPAE